jgi:hypothetical protein
MSKKGLVHDDHTKSITFLQAIREPAYVDVITTLHAHIVTFQSEDFGYLPLHLCMMGLAMQMHKNAKARVWDIIPTVQRAYRFPDLLIQRFVPPQVYRLDSKYSHTTASTSTLSPMTNRKGGNRAGSRQLMAGNTDCFPGRTCNNRTSEAVHGRYARPDHNRRSWDPDTICAACRRRGHPASQCDMLAIALFLDRYIKTMMSPSDRDKIESAWLQRWKERLGNPSRLPWRVMKTFLEEMDITPNVLDEQMDWECWPTDDDIEDFDVHLDGGANAGLWLGYDPIRCVGPGHTLILSQPCGDTAFNPLTRTSPMIPAPLPADGTQATMENDVRPPPAPPPNATRLSFRPPRARLPMPTQQKQLVEYKIPLEKGRPTKVCPSPEGFYIPQVVFAEWAWGKTTCGI